jgi:hypothetical protein
LPLLSFLHPSAQRNAANRVPKVIADPRGEQGKIGIADRIRHKKKRRKLIKKLLKNLKGKTAITTKKIKKIIKTLWLLTDHDKLGSANQNQERAMHLSLRNQSGAFIMREQQNLVPE